MSDERHFDRRPYLAAIPPSDRIRDRLNRLLMEAHQLEILLRTASEIEAIEQAAKAETNDGKVSE